MNVVKSSTGEKKEDKLEVKVLMNGEKVERDYFDEYVKHEVAVGW